MNEEYFSFVVRTQFDSKVRYDQSGIVMYLDSENWLKASIEYENETFQHLGSVVTNNGYSDWATTEIDASIKSMWYRLSRREDDYCIECSVDGVHFSQMHVCHMFHGGQTIRFGIYACCTEGSSFRAVFPDMQVTECRWFAHDGQQPDTRGCLPFHVILFIFCIKSCPWSQIHAQDLIQFWAVFCFGYRIEI